MPKGEQERVQQLLEATEPKGLREKIKEPGFTKERRIRGTEIAREDIVRWEREKFLRAYNALHEEIREAGVKGQHPTEQWEFFRKFRTFERAFTRNLDALNRQLWENRRNIAVEGPDIGKHVLPVAKFDLQEHPEPEKDSRPLDVFLGGIGTSIEENLAFSLALALRGNRVAHLTYPEQISAECPED